MRYLSPAFIHRARFQQTARDRTMSIADCQPHWKHSGILAIHKRANVRNNQAHKTKSAPRSWSSTYRNPQTRPHIHIGTTLGRVDKTASTTTAELLYQPLYDVQNTAKLNGKPVVLEISLYWPTYCLMFYNYVCAECFLLNVWAKRTLSDGNHWVLIFFRRSQRFSPLGCFTLCCCFNVILGKCSLRHGL